MSLSPVGTEMLFALGQQDNIIGVTNFCDYPEEALNKPKIGDFASLNLELLISMRTDLLVLQDIHSQFIPQLEHLKIPYIILSQNSIADICESLKKLGSACNADEAASLLIRKINDDTERVISKVKDKETPSVLVSVSRELGEPQISTFYAAGQNNFYDELIRMAGGKNAVSERNISYPQISMEGLGKLNPDVIIDLVGEPKYYHSRDNIDVNEVFKEEHLKAQWRTSSGAEAVKNGRISVLTGTIYLRPGCRIGEILTAFAKAIHPDVKW